MLQGKAAVVTGSTSGIGLAIARALAKEGANVVLNGFGEPEAIERDRAGDRAEFGVGPLHSPADMTKPDEIAAHGRARRAKLRHRRHPRQQRRHPARRAGRGVPGREVGRRSSRSTSRRSSTPSGRACPGMKARGWGRIIYTASAHSLVASPFKSAYVSGEARPRRASPRRWRSRSRRTGVTVNCISPGYVWTPLVEKQIPDTMKARGLTQGAGDQRRAARRAADEAVRDRRAGRGAGASSCARTRRARSPAPTSPWTAAGRRA